MAHGFEDLLRAVRVVATAAVAVPAALVEGAAAAAVAGRGSGRRRFNRRMVGLLVRLGPAFVKVGQVLGTRRDVLSPSLCDELARLQDDVAPLDEARSERVLRDIYGDDLRVLFRDVDFRPVAGGSIACVYRAVSESGGAVALKVQRPGIAAVMERDLRLMRRGSALAARLPLLSGMPVVQVVGQVTEAVLGQLDFPREAEALQRLRRDLAAVRRVRAPRVHAELCRPRCIVMEFVPDLDIRTAERCPPVLRRRFAESALEAIYRMLFVDGFVHCDLHRGNLYFTEAGEVVVLDAGFSVQLSDRLRRLFAEFFMNMAVGRGTRCAEIVVESSSGLGEDADLEGFTALMADLVHRSHGLPAREFSLIAFATEMFDLQRRHGVHAAPELVFPLLSLLVIEGTIRDLHPGIDFQETAKPMLNKGLFSA
ncbi:MULTISPECIES: AarF/ABC1/UbiB kinase family protein [unclassified Nocardiopsis]|uniref:ABC1 kinase family protein n=1 Tax=unclassified Nocardiopsis TaxID=2649073 RepID=UPI0019159772|nr:MULTISPECIES: AarF/UbiB family protein [unclassified Nocardiopsis]